MLEIANDSILRLSEKYSLSSLGNKQKYWLFDLDQGNIFRLNQVSHTILSMLDGKTSFAEIINYIVNNFEGENKEVIKQDGKEFIEQCLNNGIIYFVEGE